MYTISMPYATQRGTRMTGCGTSARLPHQCRHAASSAQPLGGWEAPDCEHLVTVPVLTIVSACALRYAGCRNVIHERNAVDWKVDRQSA
jgi:hypothetical protein